MSVYKYLGNAALGLYLAFAGCSWHAHGTECDFEGNIGDEHVQFERRALFGGRKKEVKSSNELVLRRPDGTVVKIVDGNNDGDLYDSVDFVVIISGGKETVYRNDRAGSDVISEAQSQYSEYLDKIIAEKSNEGLRLIKKQ